MASAISAIALVCACAAGALGAETHIASTGGGASVLAASAADLRLQKGDLVVFTLGGIEHTAPVCDTLLDVDVSAPVVVVDGSTVSIAIRDGELAGAEPGAPVSISVISEGGLKYHHLFHELARIFEQGDDEVPHHEESHAEPASESEPHDEAPAQIDGVISAVDDVGENETYPKIESASESTSHPRIERTSESEAASESTSHRDDKSPSLSHSARVDAGTLAAADIAAYTPYSIFTAERLYRVVRGDCLWRISRREYGRGARWPSIYEANFDSIDDPDLIYIDQILILPSLQKER